MKSNDLFKEECLFLMFSLDLLPKNFYGDSYWLLQGVKLFERKYREYIPPCFYGLKSQVEFFLKSYGKLLLIKLFYVKFNTNHQFYDSLKKLVIIIQLTFILLIQNQIIIFQSKKSKLSQFQKFPISFQYLTLMKYSQLKHLIQQGKLAQFQQQIQKEKLVAADYNLLLREVIKNKVKNFEKYFNLLTKKGADVNFSHSGGNKKSNLMVACEQGNLQSVQLLCSHPQIDFQLEDSMKRTAPFYAIQNKNKNDGELFLDRVLKAAPQLIYRPANNETMLILAIKKQKPQLVKILLKNGAQPNYIITDSGNTALHQAIKLCKTKQTRVNRQVVKLLYQYGADPYIKNKKAKNCFQFADKYDLKALLQQVQVRQPIVSQSIKPQPLHEDRHHINQSPLRSPVPTTKKVKLFTANSESSIDDLIRQTDQIYLKQIKQRQKQGEKKNYTTKNKENIQYDYDYEDAQNEMLSEDENDIVSQESEEDIDMEITDQMLVPYKKSEKILEQLTIEIQQFSKHCENTYLHASNQMQRYLNKISDIANKQNLDVKLYGSFNTGLWLKHCDIDILLIPRDQYIGQKNPNYVQNILDKIQVLIRKQITVKSCIKNKKIKVPMLRLEIQIPSSLSSPISKSRKIDITVLDHNHNGLAISHYISQNIKVYPQLKPLFFTIKSLTYFYKLNDPKNGGIRTYAIIIMILSFLQNLGLTLNDYSLGQLLLRFLFFFGFEYQYGYGTPSDVMDMGNGIQNIEREPIMMLTIYDPLNHSNNIGKRTNAYSLQCMLKAGYIALHSNIKGKRLQFMFDTKKIMLPF